MLSNEDIKRATNQTIKVWVSPEIEERKRKGLLNRNYKFSRAQVIFEPGKRPVVRIDKEMRVTAKVKVNRPVTKGEKVTVNLKDIQEIKVSHPKNSGYIALISFSKEWLLVFDARYNKERIKEIVKASKEFYESAAENLRKNRLRPFFENCWASAELSSNCHVLSLGREVNKIHKIHNEEFEKWGDLGNIKKDHSIVLNKLNDLRYSARYVGDQIFKHQDTKLFLKTAKEMIDDTNRLITPLHS